MTDVAEQSASTSELLAQASRQLAQLAREEVHLAQLETSSKAKKAGLGVGLLSGSGLLTLYGLGCLIVAGILGLATVVDGWLAALIVGAALFVVAGVMAMIGKRDVAEAVPPIPTDTPVEIRADITAVKEGLQR